MGVPMAVPRFRKDFASTLMTAASVDALLHLAKKSSAYAYEADRYGSIKRKHGQGAKTLGSMDRNRSGKIIVSPQRLSDWEKRQPSVIRVARTPLWEMLRQPRVLSDKELDGMEPVTQKALFAFLIAFIGLPRRSDEALFLHVCACAHLDSVAALWSLSLKAQTSGNAALAFECARYVPPALVLVGAQPFGRRVAPLIFARMRQIFLDEIRLEGKSLDLSGYDLEQRGESVHALPPLQLQRERLGYRAREVQWPVTERDAHNLEVVVGPQRKEWIHANLAPVRGISGPRQVWRRDLSPTKRLEQEQGSLRFSPDAITRFRQTLLQFA